MEDDRIVFGDPAAKLMENPDLREFCTRLTPVGEQKKSYREVKHYERRGRWLV